ncbi:MAG: substrate-binding domain-containing protein [Alcaligenaceae bacterium]
MKIQMNLQRGLLSVVLGFAIALASQAAEIHVITSGAFATAFEELAPLYEKQSSHTVKISYGSSMGAAPDAIPARLSRNEKFDILILAGPALDGFIKKGAVADGTRVDLANSTIGAVVKKGAPKPDISTVAALKTALLQAKSIAYSASASGTYLSTELFVKLGVAEQLKDTAKKIYSERVGSVVARGDAELGFQQVSELLSIPGLDYLGEIPAEVQQTVPFSAGITTTTQQIKAAKELIEFLASEKAAPIIKKTGMNPIVSKMPW